MTELPFTHRRVEPYCNSCDSIVSLAAPRIDGDTGPGRGSWGGTVAATLRFGYW
jgi:hypothetical protein